jgi:phosphoglycerol transferase MdoB-like AlkP superfamily enzyme
MRMKNFLTERGYRTQDVVEHFRKDDDGLFDLLENEVLPMLAERKKQPFVLLILNADTHAPEFFVGQKCDDYLSNEGYPQLYRSFTCFDQRLERFTNVMRKLGLDKNTELVIYGDHLAMGDVQSLLGSERNLTLFFPLRKQDEGWARGTRKPLTYYDFCPTLMELLEIDHSPPFPFGADIFGPDVGAAAT